MGKHKQEGDEEFKKKQQELLERQKAFENYQKRQEELKPILTKREKVKNLIVSWGIILLTTFFLYFLYKVFF